MMNTELVTYISNAFSLKNNELQDDNLYDALTAKINELIINDFHLLVHLLYRIDVDESKLIKLLKDRSSTDAAEIIAGLVIDRESEKIKSRNETKKDIDPGEEETW